MKHFEEKTFVYQGNYIPDAFEEYISSLERIGKYISDKKEIDLLIVRLKKESSLERARTMQRNFIAWYLRGSRGGKLKDAALVAFVSPDNEDWRFSLAKMDYRFEETPSGRIKVKEEFTPARRWSFLVGTNEKSNTAQSRFVPILENDDLKPTLEDLEQAFDIEVVTKEFFQKYRDLFIRTKVELDKIVKADEKVRQEFENKNISTVDFAKKLLGQITFLYFLQKKGWFGVERGKQWGTGPKDFIRRLFNKEFGDYQNFYNDILEPLFYEALRTNRSAADHYFSRFNCKLPFLNGGLFDPLNNYNWRDTEILIPNELFSNTNRTKEGDIGDGILDVFDRFNFTVNEEEPLEKEVALDPELLGKIYEKLNAIRQDNFDEYVSVLKSGKKGEETKFNKEFGVYYTPREIVHYMCQESLKYYLATELEGKVSTEDIETLIKYGEHFAENEATALSKEKKIKEGEQKSSEYKFQLPESIKENAKLIDEKLENIKICDPAVGSGAFPIGMMHEIVKLRKLLSVYLENNVKPYDLKRHCIKNSLYGVDIDPGAVEICKLRFWLSMIVDEEDFYTIKPLPNLDYKVVCGNSLLGFPENWKSEISVRIEKLFDEYFQETNPTRKRQLKDKIDRNIRRRLEGSKKNFGYKIDFDFRLFFPKVFHEKNGFDVVLANPPYVRQERIKDQKPLLYRVGYEVYNSTSDIYTYFYEKGWHILKPKGVLCFISSNKWMRAKYGEKLRKFLKRKTTLKQIIDFNGFKVFGATVDTNILLFQKAKSIDNTINILNIESDFAKYTDITNYFKDHNLKIKQSELDIKCFTFADESVLRLKTKIEKIGVPLKNWDVKIYRGLLTGLNEAFIITTEKRNEILANCKTEEERQRTEAIIKPILRGRDIKRYYYEWAGLWVIIIPAGWTNDNKGKEDAEKYIEKTFPALLQHLKTFEEKAQKRDDQGDYWWELRHCAYYPEFEKEKVVWAGVGTVLQTQVVPRGVYLIAPANFMVGNFNRYLQALLNSKLVIWYYDLIKTKLGDTGGRFYIYDILNLPLPPITPNNQPIVAQIEVLVDKILAAKHPVSPMASHPSTRGEHLQTDTSHWEREIDRLVYKLYELTEEEIRIIEK